MVLISFESYCNITPSEQKFAPIPERMILVTKDQYIAKVNELLEKCKDEATFRFLVSFLEKQVQ